MRLGAGLRLGCRCDVQGAARIAQQAAGNGVITGREVGVDHLAEAGSNVLALFDHQHAVEDFPFDGALRGVDDTETVKAGRHGQRIRFATVGVNRHRDFIAVHLAFGRSQLRGVIEQPAGRDHYDHRTGHSPAQRAWGITACRGRHAGPYEFVTEVGWMALGGVGARKNRASVTTR